MTLNSKLYFEDFSAGNLFPLASYTVTEKEILSFAKAYDPQPIHTDVEFRSDQFEGVIASGWHTSAIFMRIQYEGFLKNSSCIVSPGVENIQWLHPVSPGDTLSGQVKVIKTKPSMSKPDRGLVWTEGTVLNHKKITVMTVITKAFYRRRGF